MTHIIDVLPRVPSEQSVIYTYQKISVPEKSPTIRYRKQIILRKKRMNTLLDFPAILTELTLYIKKTYAKNYHVVLLKKIS